MFTQCATFQHFGSYTFFRGPPLLWWLRKILRFQRTPAIPRNRGFIQIKEPWLGMVRTIRLMGKSCTTWCPKRSWKYWDKTNSMGTLNGAGLFHQEYYFANIMIRYHVEEIIFWTSSGLCLLESILWKPRVIRFPRKPLGVEFIIWATYNKTTYKKFFPTGWLCLWPFWLVLS